MTISAARIEVLRKMGYFVQQIEDESDGEVGTWAPMHPKFYLLHQHEDGDGVSFQNDSDAWHACWTHLCNNCDAMLPQVLDAIEDATGHQILTGRIRALKNGVWLNDGRGPTQDNGGFGSTKGKAAFALLEKVVP